MSAFRGTRKAGKRSGAHRYSAGAQGCLSRKKTHEVRASIPYSFRQRADLASFPARWMHLAQPRTCPRPGRIFDSRVATTCFRPHVQIQPRHDARVLLVDDHKASSVVVPRRRSTQLRNVTRKPNGTGMSRKCCSAVHNPQGLHHLSQTVP